MDSDTVENILKIGAGILTAIGVLCKWGKAIYRKLSTPARRVKEVHQKIDYIFKELTPNSGSSLKDKINKIDQELSKNTELTKDIFYRQRWLLDQRLEPIFEADERGTCVWVNDKYLRTFERTMAECMGNGWKNLIHFDDQERVFKNWQYAIDNHMQFEQKYRIVSKSGIVYEVFCTAKKTDSKGFIGQLEILDVKAFKE